MSNNVYGYYQSPLGLIEIGVENEQIYSVKFVTEKKYDTTQNYVIEQCIKQLTKYFNKQLTKFQLPLAITGTRFQELVWSKTWNLPYGQTISYQELANKINHPQAVRTVGTALKKNPIAIIIPCHRIIKHNQKLGNYNYGSDKKAFLLELEAAI